MNGGNSSNTGSLPVWTIEVDVCVIRPPIPDNIRTATVRIAYPCDQWRDEWDVSLIAIYMVIGSRDVVMPTATRIISVEI
jgi:hypothetical protein